ncbi:flagellar assembly protein FliH [Candidatus Magnetomoraceae bacterium gMMP-15]
MSLSDDVFNFENFDDSVLKEELTRKDEDNPFVSFEDEYGTPATRDNEFRHENFEEFDSPDEIDQYSTDNFHFPSFDIESNNDSEDNSINEELNEKVKQADEIMSSADEKIKEAESILEKANQRSVEIEKQAYEEGFSKGEKDGQANALKNIDEQFKNVEGILTEIINYKDNFAKTYEKEIIDLIRRIAEKIVHVHVKLDNEVVMENIFEAFAIIAERTEVKVSINPKNMDYVNENRPEFFSRVKGLKSVTIESDPSITKGGCLMETIFGEVDASIESQLKIICQALESLYA